MNQRVPHTEPVLFTPKQMAELERLADIFTSTYQRTVEELASTINELSLHVPARRERVLHVGLFGYARAMGAHRLPRAIPFVASLYSLAVPPEFIALGAACAKRGRPGCSPAWRHPI